MTSARPDVAGNDAHSSRSERSFIIVTGPGRSGTSAVARVLHESGVRMGRDLAPPTEHNPAGFYEELPVCDLNDEIMADLGVGRLEHWPSRAAVLAAAAPYASRMDELAATAVDGWKDPRFSLLLEPWLPHLPVTPKVVVCLRSPEAFLHSVISVYGLWPRKRLEDGWANHHRRVLEVVREYGLPATSVLYEDLVDHPSATVSELSSFVDRPLEHRFVEPALQQHTQPVPAHLSELYEEVRALSRSGAVRA